MYTLWAVVPGLMMGHSGLGRASDNAALKRIQTDLEHSLFVEANAGSGKTTSATDEVKQYLKNQDTNSSEKLELPQELLELASQAEKDGVPNESLDSESETKTEVEE